MSYRRNCYADNNPQPFPIVAAFLRLGNKYAIPQLRAEAVKRLSAEYPSTLANWDLSVKHPFSKLADSHGLDFDVINLAHEIGVLSLVPAAMYCFCERDALEEVLEGVVREDGSMLILSAENQRVLVRGWKILRELLHKETYKWLDTQDAGMFYDCVQRVKCDTTRRKLFYDYFRGRTACCALPEWDPVDETGLCGPCVQKSKTSHEAGRVNVWNKLPSVFGLSEWDELLQ
jgi:hypothetical protein